MKYSINGMAQLCSHMEKTKPENPSKVGSILHILNQDKFQKIYVDNSSCILNA